MNKFYITTAIAYTNAPPHLGHALEFIQADVLARYYKQNGFEVRFLTGTDEHGIKISRAAEKAGKEPQEFVDEIADAFKLLDKKLSISNDDFIRTTEERHKRVVVELWEKLKENQDLYEKEYEGLYCIGHEAFIKNTELVGGICPIHKTEPEKVKEKNWFFKLTKYKKEIKEKIEKGELNIVPENRKKEVLNLIDDSEDISFSRPSESLKWGIPVPGDKSQTMYVWADALTNYISALGSNLSEAVDNKFWPADIHLIGKDILRFHAIYWPAMLLASRIKLPKSIYVHGFITVEGEKMSKTIGNVVDPFELLAKYGSETIRYFLLREIPSGEDGDFSFKNLEQRYNGDLANGLGNLVQRVATLADTGLNGELIFKNELLDSKFKSGDTEFHKFINDFRLHDGLSYIWTLIGNANTYINDRKPWEEVKNNPDKFLVTITNSVSMIHRIVWLLQPFLPETSEKVFKIFGLPEVKEIPEGHKFVISKGEVLFPRLS